MRSILLLTVVLLTLSYANEPRKVKLQLQWKHQFEFAGFYAAKEKGYYDDYGIDVEFVEYESV